jgi:hypothetical protein
LKTLNTNKYTKKKGYAGTLRLPAISGRNSDFSSSGIPAGKMQPECRNFHRFLLIFILYIRT